MTKGTKAFRMIVSVLLAVTMLVCAFFSVALIALVEKMVIDDDYNVWVAGVSVKPSNENDILGDGTVYYLASSSTLVFNNADIEVDYAVIQSRRDLRIKLIGENRFLCKNQASLPAIYAADNYLTKDIAIEGDGSLTLEVRNVSAEAQGITADHLTIAADVEIMMPDCSDIVNGIVCNSSLILTGKASLKVHNGAAANSSAIRVRGNMVIDEGTSMSIAVNPGSVQTCKGLSINGDLILAKNASLNVSLDDASAELGECIRVTGLLDAGLGSTLTASAKKTYAIECYGSMKASDGAVVTAASEGQDADIFCSGAVVNKGAVINAEMDALGGVHNRS